MTKDGMSLLVRDEEEDDCSPAEVLTIQKSCVASLSRGVMSVELQLRRPLSGALCTFQDETDQRPVSTFVL